MSYDQNAQYFQNMFPYARKASQQTGIPTGVILAQWGHETGYGSSDLAINALNHGGIKFVNGGSIAATNYGVYAKYNSLDQFAEDYSRVMNLSYYELVRNAQSPEDAIAAFNVDHNGERYAEDPAYSQGVLGIYRTFGLSGYNTYQGGSSPSSPVDNLSADDLKKYAGIGLAAVALFALLK